MDVDILVVGAGPTGLALALWFRTIAPNIRIQIIDQKSGPVKTARATVVHARTMELYDQLGIGDEVVQDGHIVQSSTVRPGGVIYGRLVFGRYGHGLSPHPYMLAYRQDKHEGLLIRHLQKHGIEVQWDTAFEGLVQHDTYNEAVIGGKQINARYICACDGGSSTVRSLTTTELIGGVYPQIFFAADVRAKSDQSLTNIAICPYKRDLVLYIPLDRVNETRVIGTLRSDKAHEDLTVEDVQPVIESCTGLKLDEVQDFTTYKVRHFIADGFSNKQVFFAGDAAHQHSPVGGQGMNTGLGDAANLAWKLASVIENKAPANILDTYTTERQAFATKLVDTTDRVFGLVTSKGIVGWFFRNIFLQRLLPLMWATPFLPRFIFQRLSQIEITYRHCEFNQGRVGAVHAGDRLPWVETSTGSNFDVLKDLCWQFHVYGGKAGVSTWLGFKLHRFEFTPEVAKVGLKENAVYFVRPDGHVGYCSEKNDESGIKRYIAENFLVE